MFFPLNTNPLPVGLCKGTCEEKMIYVFFYLILAHNTEYRTLLVEISTSEHRFWQGIYQLFLVRNY